MVLFFFFGGGGGRGFLAVDGFLNSSSSDDYSFKLVVDFGSDSSFSCNKTMNKTIKQ